jgi:hypothetical protein
MSNERCGNCKFYDIANEERGDMGGACSDCRRYPPQVFVGLSNPYQLHDPCEYYCPTVSATGWCGEWKPAPEGESA